MSNDPGSVDKSAAGAAPGGGRRLREIVYPYPAQVRSEIDRDEVKRQLSAVMEIAGALNSQVGLDMILATISTELRKIVDYDIACVAIYEKEENCLFIRHIYRKNGDKSGEGRYVPLDESNLVGWVAIHKKPILRRDIRQDARFKEIMKEDNLRSDIVVPLMAEDTFIGTVNIGSYDADRFTDFDLELVSKFSRLTSLAVAKERLMLDLEDLGEKYRLLMNNATDIIILCNSSGDIVECNGAVFELFGYSPDEVIGKEFFMFTPPARREEAKQTFYQVLRGEIDHMIEIPYLKKGGEVVYLEVDGSVIQIKGHPYVLAIGHDVTERKMLGEKITVQNRELKAINKKLRELDQLKSDFLGRISHELRTPLSIIMAYVGTLIEDDGTAIDEVMRKEFLQVVENQSNKLLGLINDLLDLSKVEISETMLNVSEGSINEMVRISVKIVEPFARRNNTEIHVEQDESLPVILFDPLRIRQVLVNLLNNAIKFSGLNGKITIKSARVEDEIAVSISDTGPGISEEDIPNIFENFTQLDGGATRSIDGMGIGLKLVKHYIDLHRGRIWVESELGKGSIFSFTLPVCAGAGHEPATSPVDTLREGPPTGR